MICTPSFPTRLHQGAAELVRDYFLTLPGVDTVLVANSCASGQAVPESDLDPETTAHEIKKNHTACLTYSAAQPAFLKYEEATPLAHLHADVIDGNYIPVNTEAGEPIDYFEVEIGSQVCYSAPMDNTGHYFRELQKKWVTYCNDDLRLQRLAMTCNACYDDLDHIPFFINRALYFQAFDILCKAFQEYLQELFIANNPYPIAYNKWIKE